jgi:putative ABC transport system ATP-binding protein
MTELLRFESVDRAYPMGSETVHALVDVSVAIERGDYVAVTGPSGSGKSTFMNLAGCLDTPTTGNVLVDGRAVATLPDDALALLRNRSVGFVFQQFNLLPRTDALDNVAVPLVYAGLSRPARRERARAADRATHRPAELSGGQQQRVAIARALVNRPLLLLADEPTGALDSQTSAEIMALFQRLNDDGITIILVTHEPEIADCAKRRLTFRDGRLQSDTVQPQRRHGAAS